MYRDKTQRKRISVSRSSEEPEQDTPQTITESELGRAASGVL
jgi:hypothetical protein